MPHDLGPVAGLVRLTFLIQTVYADVGRACDLTAAQAQLLCTLADEPKGMADLSRLLGLERSSLTGLVDRAEQRTYVVRRSDPSDRRAVRVALTPEGVKAVARFHDELTVQLQSVLADLPASERKAFTRTLTKLTATTPNTFTTPA
ncbi:MarR family transcriptional regulator [Kribbella sp. NBC_01245]|uniref:MarR family winged helix-turn-helix transcriptional regulator n=1 Tax=Kribbella sp. NBC_01245 TaxID=2903578 RepID=UPI002E29F52E|nr:MarR family transcriptional regulator [Kribbella sp. NBC_01245]